MNEFFLLVYNIINLFITQSCKSLSIVIENNCSDLLNFSFLISMDLVANEIFLHIR